MLDSRCRVATITSRRAVAARLWFRISQLSTSNSSSTTVNSSFGGIYMGSGTCWIAIVLLIASVIISSAQEKPVLIQGSLVAPDSEPFHLKATITEERDSSPKGTVEMSWIAPNKWRRIIMAEDFSQTLVVNDDKTEDKHSSDYFPVGLNTLVTAMVDPAPLLAEWRSGDIALTKANGAVNERGVECFDVKRTRCMVIESGIRESIGAAGHKIVFGDYRKFGGKRIARQLTYTISAGDFETLNITELEPFKSVDETQFVVDNPTPPEGQLAPTTLTDEQLRALAVDSPQIIWPQVLDGAQTGTATFYLAIDPHGTIREILPIQTANERSNDSAIRQITRWKFRPATRDGVPVQAEGLITFPLNTRAFGPADPLSDVEVRKLATNIVEPSVQSGQVPPGTEYKLWIAVDSDGIVIEQIHTDGPSELMGPCGRAIGQWRFNPIMENGQARPYRAQVIFKF